MSYVHLLVSMVSPSNSSFQKYTSAGSVTLLLEEELLLDSSLDELRMTFEEELLLDPIAALQDDDVVEGTELEEFVAIREELDFTSLLEENWRSPVKPGMTEEEMLASLLEVLNSVDELVELSLAFGIALVGKLLESEEHAKNPTLAAVTIIRDVANFLNIL